MESLLSQDKLDLLVKTAAGAPKEGVFIEVGVYKGGSLKALSDAYPSRIMYGFDTFEGLPIDYEGRDEPHRSGDFADTSFEAVSKLFKETQVRLVPGVFPESAKDLTLKIAFAHLDMDFWRGTIDALAFIWPRMPKAGIIVFDDYNWHKCPGIAPVVRTWAKAHGSSLFPYENQAILIKA
jgi:hypothetical protein